MLIHCGVPAAILDLCGVLLISNIIKAGVLLGRHLQCIYIGSFQFPL